MKKIRTIALVLLMTGCAEASLTADNTVFHPHINRQSVRRNRRKGADQPASSISSLCICAEASSRVASS